MFAASFVEGLLGFQFNIVDSGIGTRRPLIIQMMNDPARETPLCRFRREIVAAADASASWSLDELEDAVPVTSLSKEIVRRTEQRAGNSKDRVCDVPIILRVEYQHCANLTIFDTPGFRLSGNKQLRDDISAMVRNLMAPANRVIVCLEQATMEWSNSNSRPFVAPADPQFRRTIFVMTKFDNKVKELRDSEEANTYLAGENLPDGCTPFFISMPIRRNLSNPQWFKDQLKDCYLKDYEVLSTSRFDEPRFQPQLGFFRLKKYLESLLHKKYVENARSTLGILENLHAQSARELAQVTAELASSDPKLQLSKITGYLNSFSVTVARLLDGSTYCDSEEWGQNLDEERVSSSVPMWPGETMKKLTTSVVNCNLKLSGGAQVNRLMTEFQMAIHSIEFPHSPLAEVVSVLCGSNRTNLPSLEHAAASLVQKKAMEQFLPLIPIALQRYAYLTRRLADVAMAEISKRSQIGTSLVAHQAFQKELKEVFDHAVEKIYLACEMRLQHAWMSYIRFIDGTLLSGLDSVVAEPKLQPSFEETQHRVLSAVQSPLPLSGSHLTQNQMFSEEGANMVRLFAAQLWAGTRFMLAKTAACTLNSDFFQPMFDTLGNSLLQHFSSLDDANFDKIFQTGVEQLTERRRVLKLQIERVQDSVLKFRNAVSMIQERTGN